MYSNNQTLSKWTFYYRPKTIVELFPTCNTEAVKTLKYDIDIPFSKFTVFPNFAGKVHNLR